MSAYYNEHDQNAAAWLRELIAGTNQIRTRKREEFMSALPTNPSESFKKRNAHLYSGGSVVYSSAIVESQSKRIRQDSKPLMNKLETEYANRLLVLHPGINWHPQSVTLRLANGLRYTPDFFSFALCKVVEVKGKWVDGDSFPKLKMAASVYSELSFVLAWKQDGVWKEQNILP